MKYVLIFLALCCCAFAEAQTTMIPDQKFEQILVDRGIDSDGQVNGQVLTADIDTVQALNLNAANLPGNEMITNLQGIEAFAALQHLDCAYNNITQLDLTNNTQLITLHCEYNNIASLKVNGLNQLTLLYCQGNAFFTPDPVTGNPTSYYFLNLNQCPSLTMMNATNCPNLLCIQVANVMDANSAIGQYANWMKDLTATYSQCCLCVYPGQFSGQ